MSTRDVNREIARAKAEASGDKETVKRLDHEAKIDQETKQGISAGLDPKEIAVSWNPMPFASAYSLESSTTGISGWSEVYNGPSTSFTEANLLPGSPRFYRVRSINYNGLSDYAMPIIEVKDPAAKSFPVGRGTSAEIFGEELDPVKLESTEPLESTRAMYWAETPFILLKYPAKTILPFD